MSSSGSKSSPDSPVTPTGVRATTTGVRATTAVASATNAGGRVAITAYAPAPATTAAATIQKNRRRRARQPHAYDSGMVHDAIGTALRRSRQLPPTSWADVGPARVLARGEVLYRTGDPAAAAFAIEAGLVVLSVASPTGRARLVGVVGPGDLLGALDPGADSYGETAQALGAAVV